MRVLVVLGVLFATGGLTWWLLADKTRGAEIANVLAVPIVRDLREAAVGESRGQAVGVGSGAAAPRRARRAARHARSGVGVVDSHDGLGRSVYAMGADRTSVIA